MKIDIERCRKAMKQINIEGIPSTIVRNDLIEEAIKSIQLDGGKMMQEGYFGIKNYAAFGDQREDHKYGYGPQHGYIVFKIGMRNINKTLVELGEDEIYLLECVRDFSSIDNPNYEKGKTNKKINLCEAIRIMNNFKDKYDRINADIQTKEVETH